MTAIHLRDCPMCHAAPDPDTSNGPTLYAIVLIDLQDGTELCQQSYRVDCHSCGISATEEDLSAVVRRWNGQDPYPDVEDAQ